MKSGSNILYSVAVLIGLALIAAKFGLIQANYLQFYLGVGVFTVVTLVGFIISAIEGPGVKAETPKEVVDDKQDDKQERVIKTY